MQTLDERVKFFSKTKFKKLGILLKEVAKEYPVLFSSYIIIAFIDTFLFSAMSIVITNLIKVINQEGGNSLFGLPMYWYNWAIIGAVMIVCFAFSEFTLNYLSGLLTRKAEIFLRVKCLDNLTNVDLSFYSKNQIGNIMTKIVGDSQGVADGLNEFGVNLIYCFVMFTTVNTVMFSLDVKIASICLGLFFILFLISWIIFFAYQKALITSIDYKQKLDTDNTDRLMNIRLIKSSGTELYELERVKEFNKEYDKKINKTVKINACLVIFSNFFGWILPGITTILVIVLYKDIWELKRVVSLAIGFMSSVSILTSAVFLLPIILRALSRTINCNTRLNFIYSHESLIKYIEEPIVVNNIDSIEFKDVEFSYPESPSKPILPTTNLVFEKGKSYAFVGETGSGKSTIAKLLLRFYDPKAGSVLINGVNLKEIDLPSYLDKVGYVEQEPQILYGTVMDNIKYAKFDASDEEVIEAAKKAQIHDFILTLSDKYDTILGERGFMLSGGQKQRLVIARMFLKNPQLLILDEATSALDNIVEKEVQAQLDKLVVGRTTIVIAHRLSTIKNCDKIVVLGQNAQGIIQIGTFDELKEQEGRFNKLYKAGLMG
ncbi:ABC transporter ATP-binding protein [Spiroplasma apis]|uniref:ABC transporter ATP-binding protein/permease n=1 Tax=Spiroplasma apis B31 TaxID=1276258 RepID=V5RHI0_SPIAP|nr:ABC transporter B family permease/ATP-binding protein [Spiroplasma apis]AHB35923.1 ABC transporter ATP-binding protein/permease [Spiroplasma apis B31]